MSVFARSVCACRSHHSTQIRLLSTYFSGNINKDKVSQNSGISPAVWEKNASSLCLPNGRLRKFLYGQMGHVGRFYHQNLAYVGRPQEISGRRIAYKHRDELHRARRIVIRLGANFNHREDGHGLALGNLATIVEQCAELQNDGYEILIVTAGAISLGTQKMNEELRKSLSMRETLSTIDRYKEVEFMQFLTTRAAAAVGQPELMSLYEAFFAQYGVKVAQLLVAKTDLDSDDARNNFAATINDLLSHNIIPIINGNDVVSLPLVGEEKNLRKVIAKLDRRINDYITSYLVSEINADLMIFMTDVEGIYNKPPTVDGARLMDTITSKMIKELPYLKKSDGTVGTFEAKINVSSLAVENGTSVVICGRPMQNTIKDILNGRKIGTFFSSSNEVSIQAELLAKNARITSRLLQNVPANIRASAIRNLAELLITNENRILLANKDDVLEAERNGISHTLSSDLTLTPSKLSSIHNEILQIADSSADTIGRIVSKTQIAEGIELKQVTVPIGVLLVMFESQTDLIPLFASLAMATGNGLLLKGGNDAPHTNKLFMTLVNEALQKINATDAISLITRREDNKDLLKLDEYVDLVIPRGSPTFVQFIKKQSQAIPVLGYSESICHIYVDEDADVDKAIKLVRDAKCDNPAACNSVETLLIHENIIEKSDMFTHLCAVLQDEGVRIKGGPQLRKRLAFPPPISKSFRTHHGSLTCTIEIVQNLSEALQHINTYGTGHTDVIVTENQEAATNFLKNVDSACVFHNCSTRFADGYKFGLGTEAGMSTSRIHARGPFGIEGLLTTKWMLQGDGATAQEFSQGDRHFLHKKMPLV